MKIFYRTIIDIKDRESSLRLWKDTPYKPYYEVLEEKPPEYCCEAMQRLWEDDYAGKLYVRSGKDGILFVDWNIELEEGELDFSLNFCPYCGAKTEIINLGIYERTVIDKPETVIRWEAVYKKVADTTLETN